VIHLTVKKSLLKKQRLLDVLAKGLFHGGDCDSNSSPWSGGLLAHFIQPRPSFAVDSMDWTAINHALLAHLPVACGLLLPLALMASQRPGRGIRHWWTVSRYLGWMGLLGLLAALVTGFLESRTLGDLPRLLRGLPTAWRSTGPEALLSRHAVLGLSCLPLAILALWAMHRPRKDHESLGLLTLLIGLLWAGCLLATGRVGYRLAHEAKVRPMAAVPAPVAMPIPIPEETRRTMPERFLDYGALVPLHSEPVKSPAHGGRWIRVWVSPNAIEAYRSGQPLPTGALVVMSSQEDRWGRPGTELGPLYALEQKADGPALSFYWSRIPMDQRKGFDGDSRAYWFGPDPHLNACRSCHAQGMAEASQRSRWRASRVATPGN
jgi:uncharacterized membrane protein